MRKEHPILFGPSMVEAQLKGIKTMMRRIIGPGNSLVDGQRISPRSWKNYAFDFSEAFVDKGPSPAGNPGPYLKHVYSPFSQAHHRIYPLYQPNDLLYVRESWRLVGWSFEDDEATIEYMNEKLSLPLYEDEFDEKAVDWLIDYVEKLVEKGYFQPAADDPVTEEDEVLIRTDKVQPFRPGIHLPKWGSRIWDEVIQTFPQRIQDISEEDAVKEGMAIITTAHDQPAKLKFNMLWNEMHPGSWLRNDFVWVTEFKTISTSGKPLFKKLADINV